MISLQTTSDGANTTLAPSHRSLDALRATLNDALRGKEAVVEHVLACLLARGHLLLEDLPGTGKTTLAKALAGALGGDFARVQCTPNLLPGDITGFAVFNAKTREFEFRSGPVFSDVLLVDEINRATPRTQSALLEAMGEAQVTVDNARHALSDTFFVIATQNPTEQHGTYPLPEAQLDRFALKLSVGYPDEASEREMLDAAITATPRHNRAQEPTLSLALLRELQDEVAGVAVAPPVRDYLVAFGAATRVHPRLRLGISPRGLLIWQRVAQAHAFLQGRQWVTPDDVQNVASPVLEPRLAGDFATGGAAHRRTARPSASAGLKKRRSRLTRAPRCAAFPC